MTTKTGESPYDLHTDRALCEQARRLLASGEAISPALALGGQNKARDVGDDEALALWSKLRVRALRRHGSLMLADW